MKKTLYLALLAGSFLAIAIVAWGSSNSPTTETVSPALPNDPDSFEIQNEDLFPSAPYSHLGQTILSDSEEFVFYLNVFSTLEEHDFYPIDTSDETACLDSLLVSAHIESWQQEICQSAVTASQMMKADGWRWGVGVFLPELSFTYYPFPLSILNVSELTVEEYIEKRDQIILKLWDVALVEPEQHSIGQQDSIASPDTSNWVRFEGESGLFALSYPEDVVDLNKQYQISFGDTLVYRPPGPSGWFSIGNRYGQSRLELSLEEHETASLWAELGLINLHFVLDQEFGFISAMPFFGSLEEFAKKSGDFTLQKVLVGNHLAWHQSPSNPGMQATMDALYFPIDENHSLQVSYRTDHVDGGMLQRVSEELAEGMSASMTINPDGQKLFDQVLRTLEIQQ